MSGLDSETEPWVRLSGQVEALAARQHGVFTLGQLIALGLGERAVQKRAAGRHVFRVHRGVYSLAPVSLLSLEGRYLAAVLACGPDAALSHRSAGSLQRLRRNTRPGIEVTVAGGRTRKRGQIEIHRSLTLRAADITTVDGIPCTTVARTSLDLAAVILPRQLERALDQAEVLEVFDLRALEDQLARNPRAPGAPVLRAVLATHAAGSTATWSDLEELCLAVARAAGTPAPEVNAWVDPGDGEPPLRVDFVWRDQGVAVEADGHRFHRTRRAFEDDRRRDQRLTLAGWRLLRVTWRQLIDEPQRITATLTTLLTRR